MGRGETGGTNAAPIFKEFMKEAVGKLPPVPFRIPPGIRLVRVDLKSGRPSSAGVVLEAFKAGTEPGSGYAARGDRFGSGLGVAGEDDGNDTGNPDDSGSQGNNGDWGLY
jgi:penicillin-binding protein 1A